MKYSIYLFCLITGLFSIACSDDDTPPSNCALDVIVNSTSYDSATTADLSINSISIEGDCLQVDYGASGCSGDSWVIKLIDSGSVAESSPEQRFLRFDFENPESCLAVFRKQVSFDLTDIQIESDKIILNIEGGGIDESLTYDY